MPPLTGGQLGIMECSAALEGGEGANASQGEECQRGHPGALKRAKGRRAKSGRSAEGGGAQGSAEGGGAQARKPLQQLSTDD